MSGRTALVALVAVTSLGVACTGDVKRACTDSGLHAPSGSLAPPPGYVASVVLSGLSNPTQLAFDASGRLYVLEGSPGGNKDVRVYDATLRLIGSAKVTTSGESTGLLLDGTTIYVASRGRIDRATLAASGVPGAFTPVVTGLPNGLHTNNGLALAPDGSIEFGLGSTCDACVEDDPRSGTIMRLDPKTSKLSIYASGVRNSYDVAWTNEGELLATDNGNDCCGQGSIDCVVETPDRVLHVEQGKSYGWPYRQMKIDPPSGVTVSPNLVDLPMHAAATGLVEYEGDRLCPDRGAIFVTLWGTQEATTETGRRVVRVVLQRDGTGALIGATVEPFLGPGGLGQPIAVAVGSDGALYVLDYMGRIVRVDGADTNADGISDLCQ